MLNHNSNKNLHQSFSKIQGERLPIKPESICALYIKTTKD